MVDLGQYALLLSVFLSGYAIIADILGAWRGNTGLIRSGRNAVIGTFVLLSGAMVALLVLLLRSDFSVVYVAEHTARDLPTPYKISALWAGAAGSLLLWLWIQVGFVMLVYCIGQDGRSRFGAHARVIANLVSVFFLIIMINDRNPFATSTVAAAEGAGLNPLLQHPAMVLHPPILFVGYAGFLIPFAWAFGWLKHRGDGEVPLLKAARNWALGAWLFLTAGIVLGAWWAYEELGWGGYWAWDPVENSSLIPWLTGTALLHCFRTYRDRSGIAVWTMFLSLLTFSLCVFGRFLTKYGLVSSVHAFADPGLGMLYVVLLAHVWVIAMFLIVLKFTGRDRMRLEGGAAGHRFIGWGNWVFLLLAVVIFVGTLFPFLSDVFIKTVGFFSSKETTMAPVTLEPSFFTKMTSPGGILLLLLIAVCPHLFRYGPDRGWRIVLGIVSLVAACGAWLYSCWQAEYVAGISAAQWLLSGSAAVPFFILSAFMIVNLAVDFVSYALGKPVYSYEGRINRTEFFTKMLPMGAAFWLFYIWRMILPDMLVIYIVAGFILLPIMQSFPVVRRFHDIGKSGVNYFWGFVPIVNVYMGFLLLFKKGVQDSNRFGAAPQSTRIAGVRWHGARVVHVGVAIMFIGMAGSGGYGKETQVAMRPGDKTTFGGYELVYADLEANHGRNFSAMTAKMSVSRDGELIANLKPAKAVYTASNKAVSEIDVRRTLAGDLYLALTDVDINQRLINLHIMTKPLINWIWIGSTVMCVGAAMVLLALCMPKKAAANTGKDES